LVRESGKGQWHERQEKRASRAKCREKGWKIVQADSKGATRLSKEFKALDL
jgi:hypothetical protein